MSLYDDGDGAEEAPEVATPPEGGESVEADGDAEETVDVEKAAAEAVDAVEAADDADDGGSNGDDGDGGPGLIALVVSVGVLVFGLLLGQEQQQQQQRVGGV